jgi:hypothetical protein
MLMPLRERLLHAAVAVLAIGALSHATHAQQYVSHEQDITNLRLGQRILVDDGTCPAGQVKEVLGSKMSPTGVVATRKCAPRPGSKKSAK